LEENERNDRFNKILTVVKNIESEHALLISTSNVDIKGNRTQSNFYNKQKVEQPSSMQSFHHLYSLPTVNKTQPIKTISSAQLLSNPPPTNFTGPRSYHIDNCEMLYKLMKGDTKLVRSLLEANSFNFTESHEWNVLWSSSSCKSFLYEGLNEF